jgi:hypothetical protein
VIPSHLVLKQKRFSDGTLDKKKARLVANGNLQAAMTFDETASPTARMASVKLLLSIAATNHLFLKSFDIKGAFLHADIDNEIYMRIPAFGDQEELIVRLKKSLYGLKQAGKLWNDNLDKTLREYGAIPTTADPCVYVKTGPDGSYMYFCLHVDDLLLVSTSEQLLDSLATTLQNTYSDITETDASSHLGLSIERLDDGSIRLSQPGLADKLFSSFLFPDDKPVDTPCVDFPSDDESTLTEFLSQPFDKQTYMQAVGMLNYMCHSRPDITFAVSMCMRRNHRPRRCDWEAVRRIIRYLLGTRDLGTVFRSDGEIRLHAFADASYAGHDNGKSHTGIALRVNDNSAPVYTASTQQKLVALSSTEAELEALKSATTAVQWTRDLLAELGYEQAEATTVFEDNTSAIHLATRPGNWGRTKHFIVRFNYVKSMIEEHVISLRYIPTEAQLADILTKCLPTAVFTPLRDRLLGITR